MKSYMPKNSRNNGIARILGLLVAMEFLVFLLGYAAFFTVGALSDGISEGYRSASGVFYSWFAFVLLGLLGWAVLVSVLFVCRRKQWGETNSCMKTRAGSQETDCEPGDTANALPGSGADGCRRF